MNNSNKLNFSQIYLNQILKITKSINTHTLENIASEIAKLRERKGRLFFIGSGGGAGHSSHAVCDFRKIANIECYSPSDNISELTARINDDGWDTSYSNWLKVSQFNKNDGIFIFSVGGGNVRKNISVNLVNCINLAKSMDASIMGVVGKDGGYSKESSELILLVPTVDEALITPHTEGWQSIIWHLLVSHPLVAINKTKWEETK